MPDPTRLRSALWLPLFDDLADPLVAARPAAAAEEAGWHWFFVWNDPGNLSGPGQLAGATATITGLRPDPAAPYDIAIPLPPGTDPAPYAQAGATWWLTEFEPDVSLDQVRGVLRDGPAVP